MSEKTLGEIIRQYRKEGHLTQKEFAQKLNKAESTVRMWELNKNVPSLETLKDISASLDIPLGELMMRAGFIEEYREMLKSNFYKNYPIPTFGEAVKNARTDFEDEEEYISLEDLAKKTNIPKSTLEEIENDVNISLSNEQILELSNALDITFSYLFLLKHIGLFIQRLGVFKYEDVLKVSSMTYPEYLEAFGLTDRTDLDKEQEEELLNEFKFVKQVDDLFRLFIMTPNFFDVDNIYKLGFMVPKINGRKLSKNDIQKIIEKVNEMADEFEYQD